MSKVILHIDLNAFFIRCEEIKDPSLEGKPVIVGGDGRKGIVSTSSYKAREYGIHSGMPTFQAKMMCKDLIILPCDFNMYELMSREFIHYIKRFSDKVEQMSIDECFVDITESFQKYGNNDIHTYLKNIQDGLYNKFKLKCSIGVAPTKFLAKMASDIKKPMGITIVRKRDIKEKIFPLHISSYFGIGKKTYPKLESIGIKNIGDLYYAILNRKQDVMDIIGNFSDGIINQLEGNSSDEVFVGHNDPKSIGVSRTLNFDSNDALSIRDFLLSLAKGVCEDMKSKGFLTKTITIQYKDANHDNDFKSTSVSKSFDDYTDDIDFIVQKTKELFDKTYNGLIIRLIGFSVKNLAKKGSIIKQMTFEDCNNAENDDEIEKILGDLNRSFSNKQFIRLSDLEKK